MRILVAAEDVAAVYVGVGDAHQSLQYAGDLLSQVRPLVRRGRGTGALCAQRSRVLKGLDSGLQSRIGRAQVRRNDLQIRLDLLVL